MRLTNVSFESPFFLVVGASFGSPPRLTCRIVDLSVGMEGTRRLTHPCSIRENTLPGRPPKGLVRPAMMSTALGLRAWAAAKRSLILTGQRKELLVSWRRFLATEVSKGQRVTRLPPVIMTYCTGTEIKSIHTCGRIQQLHAIQRQPPIDDATCQAVDNIPLVPGMGRLAAGDQGSNGMRGRGQEGLCLDNGLQLLEPLFGFC